MDECIKTYCTLIAAIAAIITLWLNYLHQRRKEVREFLSKLYADKMCMDFFLMLDYDGRHIEMPGIGTFQVFREDFRNAIQIRKGLIFGRKDGYIRDCFDMFLRYCEIAEMFAERTLIRMKNLKEPFGYYFEIMEDERIVKDCARYINKYATPSAIKFLGRFGNWKSRLATFAEDKSATRQ